MPIDSPEKQLLKKQYQNRFNSAERYRQKLWSILCARFFQNFIPHNATVLELGSGWGEFINQIQAKNKIAIDLNPDAGNKLSKDIQFLNQDCSASWVLDKDSVDVIFTSNFLEHLPDKKAVEKTLKQAEKVLKKDGIIICLGPNIRFLPGSYWDFWDHHIPISDNSLAELLELQGFTVEKKIAKFLPYTMSDGNQPPLFLVEAYLKLPLAWKILGKQFLIIASI